ncbi:TetR family transcriptional regulator [Sinanaerobacter chloroacetimidivorans]|uniref:TetR/AcrR family transcriptional regulator n=1 Tax=Sinanaerobacter chloroacetimidivorans TaxID=2818044 RepID=A0A8J7W7E1_9FIRM|nr:TetR/AcrR family transcriptional regulator [Sinanaerobacter chloroacetimidivorans]MBR0600331.1 TetR/AcrR family transcriptional regulator [Sinanaerobacter chloroacetimidivorans]
MEEELYREKILKSAQNICKREGAKSLTVDNIVAESKISKRSFYKIFPTKHDFLSELNLYSKGCCPAVFDERMAIIQAAEEGISKYGFNNINLETIAGAVGLKRGAIYKYFNDKYDLLEDCIEFQFSRLKALVEEMYQQNKDDPVRFFKLYITGFGNFINYSHDTTIYTEVFSHLNYRKKIRAQAKGLQDYFETIFSKCLKIGIEMEIFREDVDVETVAEALLLTVNGMGFYIGDEESTHKEIISPKTIDAILNILFNSIMKEPNQS